MFSKLYFVFLIGAVLYGVARHKGILPRGAKHERPGPIISSRGLLTSGKLTSLHKGESAGFPYNLIAAGDGRVIIYVQLHHDTRLHLVAIGSKSKLGPLISMQGLRKLDLEGDFPNYFQMYCGPKQEQELLQIFDPADMAYFVDFCQAYDFELHRDTIYISRAADAYHDGDTTPLAADIQAFLERNARLLRRIEGIK